MKTAQGVCEKWDFYNFIAGLFRDLMTSSTLDSLCLIYEEVTELHDVLHSLVMLFETEACFFRT